MADTERNNKKINITELKNAFKEGAIPNEQDYGNLIDLAAVGGGFWEQLKRMRLPCN